jgi:hypothetical protein
MSDPADDVAMPPIGRTRLKKAPNAFRTISEVADELHIPQHVLRFWETKFPQVKPLKRGGGRRYYRTTSPCCGGFRLLYIQGFIPSRACNGCCARAAAGCPMTFRAPADEREAPTERAGSAEPDLPMPRTGARRLTPRTRQCAPRPIRKPSACVQVRPGTLRGGGLAGPAGLVTAVPAVRTQLRFSGRSTLTWEGAMRSATRVPIRRGRVEVPPPWPRVLSANRA